MNNPIKLNNVNLKSIRKYFSFSMLIVKINTMNSKYGNAIILFSFVTSILPQKSITSINYFNNHRYSSKINNLVIQYILPYKHDIFNYIGLGQLVVENTIH